MIIAQKFISLTAHKSYKLIIIDFNIFKIPTLKVPILLSPHALQSPEGESYTQHKIYFSNEYQ